MAGEFSLIDRYFGKRSAKPCLYNTASGAGIAVGIGDDCAAFSIPPGHEVLTSVDTLVEGIHFFPSVTPQHLGHKCLAVSLSDLAACGAEPIGFLLALTLPAQWSTLHYGSTREDFLEKFSDGLHRISRRFACPLIGGDTASTVGHGPLIVSITVFGQAPTGAMLKRRGAQYGDDIWLSGPVGGAALALQCLFAGGAGRAVGLFNPPIDASVREQLLQRFRLCLECPEPRVALGIALRGLATSCIDVSDGLAGDLGHVLGLGHCGAILEEAQIPVPSELGVTQALFSTSIRRQLVLHGGDDYELCFTAHVSSRGAVGALAQQLGLSLQRVGRIVTIDASQADSLIRLHSATGQTMEISNHAYEHFK